MGVNQSTDNAINGHTDEFHCRQHLYKAAKSDDVYEFSYYFTLVSREHRTILKNKDFISWLISISIQNNSMNVLKYITLQDKEQRFLSDCIFKELLLEQLDGHEIANFSVIKWMKQNCVSLDLTEDELESSRQNLSEKDYNILLKIFKHHETFKSEPLIEPSNIEELNTISDIEKVIEVEEEIAEVV